MRWKYALRYVFSTNLVAWQDRRLVLASLLKGFLRQRRPKTNGCCRWANCSAAQLNSTARAPWFAFAVRANVRRRQWRNWRRLVSMRFTNSTAD